MTFVFTLFLKDWTYRVSLFRRPFQNKRSTLETVSNLPIAAGSSRLLPVKDVSACGFEALSNSES
jgi:hypothetical protein